VRDFDTPDSEKTPTYQVKVDASTLRVMT